LQIDLYSGTRANDVEPENYAIAINTECPGCTTVARAIQYVQPVDDPDNVPNDVQRTVDQLDRSCAPSSAIRTSPSPTPSHA